MAIQLQTKSDEITNIKDEMKDQTTKLESDLKVIMERYEYAFIGYQLLTSHSGNVTISAFISY